MLKGQLSNLPLYLAPHWVGRHGTIGVGAADVNHEPGFLRCRLKGIVVTINEDADGLGAVVVPTKTLHQQVLKVEGLEVGAEFVNLYLH